MKPTTILPFALKNGHLVEVCTVPSGLKCECFCPTCGGRLIAKKGKRNRHHFAHHKETECSGGLETAMHILCKQILAASSSIMLPKVILQTGELLSKSRKVPIDQIWLEERIRSIVPDLVIRSGNKKLAIEITCTHPPSETKINFYREYGIAALEFKVNELISYWTKGSFPLPLMCHHLLNTINYKSWIYNPKQVIAEQKIWKDAAQRQIRKQHRVNRAPIYIVQLCPEKKRQWASSGLPYANVFEDCLHCIRCLDIHFQKEWLGEIQVRRNASLVVCKND